MACEAVDTRIALVGGGKMGEAILGGWISSQTGQAASLDAANFTVVNPGEQRRSYLQDTYGVVCVEDSSQLEAADIVVLAVKPQMLDAVLPVVASLPFAAESLVVSIAAGWTTERIESYLPADTKVVRVMPNTPLMVGAGASCICGGSSALDYDVELVRDLFGCLGNAWVVKESDMDAVCAVSGSGPAYVAAMIEAMASGAQKAGLSYEFGEALAVQTVFGTAKLMLDRGQAAEKTRKDVCSPGGTTLAGLDAMYAQGFTQSVEAGVDAACQRSIELGKA